MAIAGSSMAFIDSSAVNVALPSIGRDLKSSAAALQWVIEGYALFLSALILVGGSLGDVYGRRRIFVAGIAIFALASAACAAAPSIEYLDAARCLQGIGGALATPGSLALISAHFTGSERGRAIGTWSGFAAITAAVGPLLGGWLAQSAGWRYVFLINIPPAIFVIAAATLFVPESRDEKDGKRSIDLAGAMLITAALGGLTFGLIGLQDGGGDRVALLSTGAGLVLLLVFVGWEHRASAPMIPAHIFANRTFAGANLYTFFLYGALGGSLFFVPFDLQNVHGYGPAAAGAAMLPFILIMFAFARWSGGLVGRIGARMPLVAGAIVAGFGFLAYARIGVDGPYWQTFLPAAIVLGCGGALFVAPLTTAVMDAIDTSQAGIASGINNAVSRVAALLAVAGLGIVLALNFYGAFDTALRAVPLSEASRDTLRREHAALATGRPLATLNEPDRTRVNAAIAASFTAGLRWIMVLSALASWLAAAIAFVTVPAFRRPQAAPEGGT